MIAQNFLSVVRQHDPQVPPAGIFGGVAVRFLKKHREYKPSVRFLITQRLPPPAVASRQDVSSG